MIVLLTFLPIFSYSVTMDDADSLSDLAKIAIWESTVHGEEDNVLESDRWGSDGYEDEGSFSIFGELLLNTQLLIDVIPDAEDSMEMLMGFVTEVLLILYFVAAIIAIVKAVKTMIGAFALFTKPCETVLTARPKLTFRTYKKRKAETYSDYTYLTVLVAAVILLLCQMFKSFNLDSVIVLYVNYVSQLSGVSLAVIPLVAVIIASIVVGSMLRKSRVGTDVTDEEK